MPILLYKTDFLHMPMFSHLVVPGVTWSKSSSSSILHIYYMYANNGDIAWMHSLARADLVSIHVIRTVVSGVGSCHFLEEIFELGSARPGPPLNL